MKETFKNYKCNKKKFNKQIKFIIEINQQIIKIE